LGPSATAAGRAGRLRRGAFAWRLGRIWGYGGPRAQVNDGRAPRAPGDLSRAVGAGAGIC